jgi:benzoyl-CoA reductase/2-hydroxyglutaryl-CoA dehydratase subunit BcrC/BadD/HgdB
VRVTKRIHAIISELKALSDHPGEAVKKLKGASGKKMVGLVPYYGPEEIVYAAGMQPVGVWGGEVEVSSANTYLPPFACPLTKSILELALRGVYDDLSAMLIPSSCENLKLFGQNFRAARPGIPFIPLVHPQNRKTLEGIEYLAREYERIARTLAAISGSGISEASLQEHIAICNDHRRAMREFAETAAVHPAIITPRVRQAVIKSSYFMDKAEHTVRVRKLVSLLREEPQAPWPGKRVVVTGIMAEPAGLMELFEELHIAIVADDLAQASRSFRTDVPEGGTPLERLARRWANMEGCSLCFDPGKERNRMLKELVTRYRADGLIVLMMQFCDPEEMDYPLYRKELEQAGISLLCLEVEPQMPLEQARNRLQSFVEMLR